MEIVGIVDMKNIIIKLLTAIVLQSFIVFTPSRGCT
jgi:hypothetical protein